VVTSLGTVLQGNTTGDTSVLVQIGSVPAASSITLRFDVTLENPKPAGVNQVANQGLFTSDGGDVPTDDPDTPDVDDPTITPLGGAPDLVVSKDDGVTSMMPPGNLTYTIVVQNVGNRGASGVVITDTLPPNTIFQGASDGGLESSPGVVTWPTFTLQVGEMVTRTVSISVPNQPVGAPTTLINTVHVEDDGMNGIDPNPGDNDAEDPTDLVFAPIIDLLKEASMPPAGGFITGAPVTWTFTISNTGNQDASNLTLTDTLIPELIYSLGTMQYEGMNLTDALDSDPGSFDGVNTLSLLIDHLPAQSSQTFSFVTVINVPQGNFSLPNQGIISDGGGIMVSSDDPNTGDPDDPTVITVTFIPVPTLSFMNVMVLTLLIMGSAIALRRKRMKQT
ncbi:MAG: DUF11 domain-containing protein, partial [Acidobacteria bacterium]|nr:DUF11 domain-containing protein [Acidobacteriota bacterium]